MNSRLFNYRACITLKNVQGIITPIASTLGLECGHLYSQWGSTLSINLESYTVAGTRRSVLEPAMELITRLATSSMGHPTPLLVLFLTCTNHVAI